MSAPDGGGGSCSRLHRWIFPGLAGLLIILRLGIVGAYPWIVERVPAWAWSNNDGYDAIAANWMETGVYSWEPGVPTALRLPLYPALIAGTMKVTGKAYPEAVMGIQALLSILTGLILYRMTAGLLSRRSAALALLIFIFHPQVNNFVFRCATETVYVFLLALLADQSVLFLRNRRLRHLLGASAALSLSLLTRQTLLPLLWLGTVALLVWSFHARRECLRRLGWSAAAMGLAGLLLAPWLVRNARQGGGWALQTWVGQPLCQGAYVTRNLDAFLDGEQTLTELDQRCLAEIGLLERRVRAGLPENLPPIGREAAIDRAFRDRARALAARDPESWARRTVRNLLWAPVLQMTWASTRILMCIQWPLLLLGLWGSCRAFKVLPNVRCEAWPIWILAGYLWVAHALAWPQARYLLPGLVPFFGFSAYGLIDLFSRLGWPLFRMSKD